MAPRQDEQPFLKYTDDEAQYEETKSAPFEASARKRRWRFLTPVVSHAIVFVLTSLLWIFIHRASSAYAASASSPPSQSPVVVASPSTSHSGSGHDHHEDLTKLPPGSSSSSGGGGSARNATSSARLVSCGNSNAEAKALGCSYDILLNHWVAPQCRAPREWLDEYTDDNTWYGYLDEARTQRIEGGAVAMGEVDHYWTSTRDHVNHCVQLWRLQYLALFEGRSIDTVTASWGHTEHCSQFLLDATDRIKEYYNEPIKVEVGWAGCWVKEGPE